MRRPVIWIPLIALLLIAGVTIYGLARQKDDFVYSHMIGQPLPAFNLPAAAKDVQGLSNIDFADGQPRMLNIFASWCVPCRAEAPFLEQLKARGMEITAIAIRDNPDDVAEFLARYGNPFTRIGADKDMKVQLALGSSGVPESYIIGGDGRILYQHIGDIRAEHVPEILAKWQAAK